MQPAQVKIHIALFCYGGNGGLAMMAPELGLWLAKTYHEMKLDPRISGVGVKIYSDTPITMTRNRAVRDAGLLGCDMVLMLDSDNEPDGYLRAGNDSTPYWETAFSFAHERLVRGIPTVIAAPYCGPPPEPIHNTNIITQGDVTYAEAGGGEVPYLFQWSNRESDCPHTSVKIDLLTRNEAARLSGIYPVAALPTGVCLFTLNAFEGLPHPYFKYEMNEDGSEKQSTEDVVATRDISVFWKIKKDIDVLYATCDSWALHHKTKKVGRPQFVPLESISKTFVEAIRADMHANEAMQHVDYGDSDKRPAASPSRQSPPPPLPLPQGSKIADLPRNGDRLGDDVEYVRIAPDQMEFARALLDVERAQEAEKAEAAKQADGTLWEASDRWEPNLDYATAANDGRTVVEEKVKQNGDCLKHKMIGGRKVAMVPAEVSDESLEQIESMASWLADKAGPLEVAVVHPGAGQSAAAILSALPEGSHLYALDSIGTYKMSSEPSRHFMKSFEPELDSGRVMANIEGRKFPYPENKNHLDLVFIERSLSRDKLLKMSGHVRAGGLIAGLGYSDHKALIDSFPSENVTVSGDVWAMRV